MNASKTASDFSDRQVKGGIPVKKLLALMLTLSMILCIAGIALAGTLILMAAAIAILSKDSINASSQNTISKTYKNRT